MYYTVKVVQISRRHLLKGALAFATGAAAGTVAHGYGWERYALGVTRVDLPLSGLPPALEGLRIGFLTDLHHSAMVPAELVSEAVALLNAEQPDLIVLGGDYVSFGDRTFMAPVAERLGALGARMASSASSATTTTSASCPAELRRRGVEMLLDDRTTVEIRGERLELAGVKFWTKTRPRSGLSSTARSRHFCCWRTIPAASSRPRRSPWPACWPAIRTEARSCCRWWAPWRRGSFRSLKAG